MQVRFGSEIKPGFTGTRWRLAATLGAALCLLIPSAPAQSTNRLQSLERLVQQWVDLRAQLANEQRAWSRQETQLQDELALYEKERVGLSAEVAIATRQQQSHDQEQLELATRKENLDTVLASLLPTLDRAEAELRHWQARIPPPLAGPLNEAFSRLPATHEASRQIPAPRRLQVIVALYGQIEDLGNAVHVAKQLLDDGQGGRREMDVVYLGLAQGFAVAPDGAAWAAIGAPTRDGWRWESRPELASNIRTLVAIQRKERTAELVSLPLRLAEVSE